MIPRLYIDVPLIEGGGVDLDSARAHYLRDVLRREPGATLRLFNGRDGEWQARIERLTKAGARLAVEHQTRQQQSSPDLWLVFAPIKRDRIDLMAEKATELGCRSLLPVFTQHTAMTRVNVERLQAHAIEAAEQSERLDVPDVQTPVKLGELLVSWSPSRRLLVCAESGAAVPMAAALAELPSSGAYAVLTGPEGGFARYELDALGKLPFVTAVGLGPRVLRADTAAIAALACWQTILGDGRDRPPAR
jgi:16S rRNA (uracil1498-N3)-methyltransferase